MITLIPKFDVTTWLTNNHNTHIAQYLTKQKATRQPKYGQVIEYDKKNIFLQNNTENEVGRLVADLSLFFKKSLYQVKTSALQLSFNIF